MKKRKLQEERALAHIEKIEWVKPIEGADNIELIGVLGWICIAKKGEFSPGDLAVYIEIDSKCPRDDERFAFLEAKDYKVKTMKIGRFHVISQGLALPLTLFPELKHKRIGSDVTRLLNITYGSEEDSKRKSRKADQDTRYKWMVRRHPKLFQNPFIKKMVTYPSGKRLMLFLVGRETDYRLEFPDWILRTNEVRIENAAFYLQSTDTWVKTEKLDGCSGTYAVNKLKQGDRYEFIVCSRNVRLPDKKQKTEKEPNIYWEMAEKYEIERKLKEFASAHHYHRVVLQGECIGMVQGNPYKLKENDFYGFNLVIDGKRTSTQEMAAFCNQQDLKHVPIFDMEYKLCHTMEEMKLEADGASSINPKVMREGFVYRSQDGKQSFKNVSREYLLKHNG